MFKVLLCEEGHDHLLKEELKCGNRNPSKITDIPNQSFDPIDEGEVISLPVHLLLNLQPRLFRPTFLLLLDRACFQA